MKRRAVLVIRGDDRFSEYLRQNGFEVLNLELIRTEPVDDLSEFAETIARIGEYDGIFITSPAAAEILVRQLNGDGLTFSGKTYVLGERAKAILERSGLEIAAGDAANTAEDVIASFKSDEFAGKRLLFVRGERTVGTIPKLLKGVATVDEAIVYRTCELDPGETVVAETTIRFQKGEIGQICFFSPSGVDVFKKLFPNEDIGTLRAAAIGKTTAESVARAGFDLDFVSLRATAEDFAVGVAAHLKEIE
jgi:uroporphyrinogen-III synthase